MQVEPTRIDVFISRAFSDYRVQRLIGSWRVENDALHKIALERFREMGIYQVPMFQRHLFIRAIITILQTTPEIRTMINRADKEEDERRAKRFTE